MAEWNAAVYHRVSNPQLEWGLPVLARLPLDGDERVLDVGCGTGRLTERLLDRLPRGVAVGVDGSANMLRGAREYLAARHGHHVSFVHADAAALPFRSAAHAIFSTATFHWVLDHERLFASLFAALAGGGRLVAQCGGGPNLHRIHERSLALMRDPQFAACFSRWTSPWQFADALVTERRLRAAGFGEARAWIEPAPVVLPDAPAFLEFIEHVICRPHLSYLPDAAMKARFLERLTDEAAGDDPPFELDYWRLNIDARRS